MSQTDLLRTILGALVGFTLPYLLKSLAYAIRRLQRARLEGKWFVYHSTNKMGKLQVEPSTWYVRKGFTSLFSIKEERQGNAGPITFAEGEIHTERNFLLVKLKAKHHEEEVTMRLFNPISTADEIIWGLYLSLDFQGNPIAGPIIISRRELSDAEILGFLSKKVNSSVNMKLLMAQAG